MGTKDCGWLKVAKVMSVSQTEGCILRRSHFQAAYVIKPGLFQLTEHYIHESWAYYNDLCLTKNNGQVYNC